MHVNITLTDRERMILCRHLIERQTLAEISRVFGITSQRVGQLHAHALEKLAASNPAPLPTSQARD